MSDLFDFLNNYPKGISDQYNKDQYEKILKNVRQVRSEAMDYVENRRFPITEIYCNKQGVIEFWQNVKRRPLTDEEKNSIEEGTYKFENYIPVKQY